MSRNNNLLRLLAVLTLVAALLSATAAENDTPGSSVREGAHMANAMHTDTCSPESRP